MPNGREGRPPANESLFREVNERIAEGAWRSTDPSELDFVCECGDAACFERLVLTREEYEAVREHQARFLVAPDHEEPEVERIVELGSRYAVVEKRGAARQLAEEFDPRSRRPSD